MRARDIQMSTTLHFRPDLGCIYLHNKRVVLVNADALGTLRKDLISALGLERARGFLTRYGFASGYHDAIDMRDRFDWADEREWLFAAPYLHAQEGVSQIKVLSARIDKGRGEFHVEGVWQNSYEAEQHVHHFGHHRDPVCWTLAGYAGGYGSAYMGERVLYREVQCVGRGDPVCRYIGKTLRQWGPEVAADLPYYEETKIGEELEQAYRQIQHQHALLHRTSEIHEELTRLILAGGDLSAITAGLARLLGRPVLVEDREYRLVAAHPPAATPADGRGPVALAAGPLRRTDWLVSLGRERRPATLPADPGRGLDHSWLVAPIAAGEQVLGYVALPSGEGDELESMVLERVASVCALEMLREQAVAAVEQRVLGDLLESLVTEGTADSAVLHRRARYLGLDPELPCQVLAVDLSDLRRLLGHDTDEARFEEEKRRLATALRRELQSLSPGSAATVRGEQLVVLYRLPPEAAGDGGDQAARALLEHICSRYPGGRFNLGAGTVCQDPRAYAASYREAREVLAVLRALGRSGAVLAYADLGPYAALFRGPGQAELTRWANQLLGPLLQYDQKRGGDWLRTLEAYLNHDCSLTATAAALSLHLSGLKYRLQRIAELLQADLSRSHTRFELHLALLVVRVGRMAEV